MKTKYILIIAGVVTLGLYAVTHGTWLPSANSQQAYGYSPETNAWQDNYAYTDSSLSAALEAQILAHQAAAKSDAAVETAYQSHCAAQIGLANSKLKDVGDKDPTETTRLQNSVVQASQCLLVHSPAFN